MTVLDRADFVKPDQRRRVVAALIHALERGGPSSLTVEDIVAAGPVRRQVFYRYFEDVDDCFDFSCDAAFEYLFGPFDEAYAAAHGPWEARLDAALGALLGAISREPSLGELCLVHSPARQRDRHTYQRAVDELTAVLCGARPDGPAAEALSVLGEDLLARGTLGLIAARLAVDHGEGLEDLAPELIWLITAPLGLGVVDSLPSWAIGQEISP
jgi:AcrR family transcriptional regulator